MSAAQVKKPEVAAAAAASTAVVKKSSSGSRLFWPSFYAAWLGGFYHVLFSVQHKTHRFGTPFGRTGIVAGSIFGLTLLGGLMKKDEPAPAEK